HHPRRVHEGRHPGHLGRCHHVDGDHVYLGVFARTGPLRGRSACRRRRSGDAPLATRRTGVRRSSSHATSQFPHHGGRTCSQFPALPVLRTFARIGNRAECATDV